MKQTLKNIWELGVKEIIGLGREPLLLALIVYSFTASIYLSSKAFPDSLNHAAIAIVDDDNSPLSKRVTDAFLPPMFVRPVKITSAEMDSLMDRGRFTFVVVFPPNFQEKVLANNRPEVQLNVDATRMSQAFIGNSYIQAIIVKEVSAFIKENTNAVNEVTAEALIRNRFNSNLTTGWDGGITELINNITMLAMILTGAALIRERERGTLEHLLVMPVTPFEIMMAKIWSMSLVVLIASIISMEVVIGDWLNVPIEGSIWLYMLGVLLNLFALTSLGIFLACFAKDMPQLGILMILVLMPMQILSGGTTSQENMPAIIRYIMQLAPTTHIVDFTKAIILRGAGFEVVWATYLKMIGLGAIFFVVALNRFRKTVAS